MSRAPERVETERLILRRPTREAAESIFARFAGDAETTRFVSWPRHRSIEDTFAFLDCTDAGWARWPAGHYVIALRTSGEVIGSTGFAFETSERAVTGYILAKDCWGKG